MDLKNFREFILCSMYFFFKFKFMFRYLGQIITLPIQNLSSRMLAEYLH